MKYVALCLLILTSCRSHAVFREIDPSFNRMQVQPRVDPYEESAFFSDGLDMRQPPRGTVPFSPRPTSTRPPLTRALLERGQNRFDITCAACHGPLGNGDTVVAEHMQRRPPSLHEPRIGKLSDAELYRVIREGYGYMPSYAAKLPPKDSWAVVAYVRALRLSQNVQVSALSEHLQRELRKEAQ
ncbi:MAG: cytochrome c [Myxococcales bacterium]|nr:cytochrome c [Myxococcales bacterium]MCB9579252.1 cytochrome c [Polyangiaceae bacterium]